MGFIYQIKVNNELYIGSTKQKLKIRQNDHNCNLNNSNRKGYNYPLYKFCREHNVKKIICELIEKVNDSELVLIEQEYMNKLKPTLNKQRAFQTKEQLKEQTLILGRRKINCPICGLNLLKNSLYYHMKHLH